MYCVTQYEHEICISQLQTQCMFIMSWWAEPQRHTVVCLCFCLSVCVTLQLGFLEARDKLGVDTCNIGTTQQYLKANSLQFKAVFSSSRLVQSNLLTLTPIARDPKLRKD